MACYRCGGPHYKISCPHVSPARRIWPYWPWPAFPARRDPAPPSPAYLDMRAALGMPSAGLPSPLVTPCPWCRAAAWSPCANPGTGQRTGIHQARKDATA